MGGASTAELRLAQSRTEEYVTGLQGGIRAATQYFMKNAEFGIDWGLHAVRRDVFSMKPQEVHDRTLELLNDHDWEGVAAITHGMVTGIEDILTKNNRTGGEDE
jgi:hypothetical protein